MLRGSALLLATIAFAGCNAKDRDDPSEAHGTNATESGDAGPVPATTPGLMDTLGTVGQDGLAPIVGDNMGVDTAGALPSGATSGPGSANPAAQTNIVGADTAPPVPGDTIQR